MPFQKLGKKIFIKERKNFHDLTFRGHHIIKKYQIYSLIKCNSKELSSLQVSLNDTKTKSQIYFEKLFPNKKIEWKCIYLMPRRAKIDTNLRIFQYKILNNVLYLNEKLFKFKLFLHLFVLFVIRKMKPLYTFFTTAIKQNLFGLNYKSY